MNQQTEFSLQSLIPSTSQLFNFSSLQPPISYPLHLFTPQLFNLEIISYTHRHLWRFV
ncbi:hypothetical protein EVA_20008 [gut metagenome]|uniref:Uncharacterized protein n=1 Tax=gut metagenome TaxID=749906 RepID=J9FAF2_9ZZZZ